MPDSPDNRNEPAIWILAGEPSGDAYGADVARAVRERAPCVRLRGMGCAAMADSGVELFVDATALSVMGFVEVVKHLPAFRDAFRRLMRQAKTDPPAAAVFIDNPGFNLRLAKKLHRQGIPVVYYICPQVWAWGKRRIPIIAENVDRLLAIFPFEPELFAGTGLDARFVGHPLVSRLRNCRDESIERDPNTVLLLPGSRVSELEALLPDFLRAAQVLYQQDASRRFVISVPSGRTAEIAAELLRTHEATHSNAAPARVATGETLRWMQAASAGIAASGTVTLEAAILGLPLVVAYRLNSVTYRWARRLVKLDFFSIVNLIVGHCVFEEFLQDAVRSESLAQATDAILPGGRRRATAVDGMRQVVERLGPGLDVPGGVANAALELARLRQAEGPAREAER